MIQGSAAQKPFRQNMSAIFRDNRTQIPGIRQALKKHSSSFRKACCHIRIQCPEKADTILYLSLAHIKFIPFFSPGNDHKIIYAQLPVIAFICAFFSHIGPYNVSTWKTVYHHMSGKYQKSIFNSYLSVLHVSPLHYLRFFKISFSE